MEVLRDAPLESAFTSLLTHQSQTPDSFFSGPPILYYHSQSATLQFHAHDLILAPALSNLVSERHRPVNGSANGINGDGAAEEHDDENDEEIEVQNIDIWVTSESVSTPNNFQNLCTN